MENVEEQILSYPHLPEEKQREVEEYVEQHPKWAPLLRDVRALESCFRNQRFEEESDGIEALLSAYVVARHVQPGDESSVLGEGLDALKERVEERPDLRERVEEIRRRLERVPKRERMPGVDRFDRRRPTPRTQG